jgi:predicted small lipoprotein YifL
MRRKTDRAMRAALVAAALAVLGACGDKVPQSEAAKQLGSQPKQTVDKASQDAAKALQQGADRTREADKKAE